jgi:hypothetical protein
LTNAFYSFDLASRKASAFIPAGGGLWGRRGASISPEGTVYLGTGDAQFDPSSRRLGNGIVGVKIDAGKQLQLADFFGAPNANWLWRRDLDVNVTPVAFDYRNRKFLVGTSKACQLWLLDREALGGEDHRTALQRRAGLRRPGDLGFVERVAGFTRRAVGTGPVLGPGQQAVQGPD